MRAIDAMSRRPANSARATILRTGPILKRVFFGARVGHAAQGLQQRGQLSVLKWQGAGGRSAQSRPALFRQIGIGGAQ